MIKSLFFFFSSDVTRLVTKKNWCQDPLLLPQVFTVFLKAQVKVAPEEMGPKGRVWRGRNRNNFNLGEGEMP